MIAAITGFFAKPLVQYGAIALVLIALAGAVTAVLNTAFDRGADSGKATVTDAVQTKTITDVEKARITKEKADAEVNKLPYDERVDGLR